MHSVYIHKTPGFNGHVWEVDNTTIPPSIESFNCKKCGVHMVITREAQNGRVLKTYSYVFNGKIISAPNEELSCDFVVMNNVLK